MLDAIEQFSRDSIDRPVRRSGELGRAAAEAPVYRPVCHPIFVRAFTLRLVLDAGCPPLLRYLQQLVKLVACRVIPAEAAPSSDPASPDRRGGFNRE